MKEVRKIILKTVMRQDRLFVLMLYFPINSFNAMPGSVLGQIGTKQKVKCLAHGHNKVPLVRLGSTTPKSQIQHSTTEPL